LRQEIDMVLSKFDSDSNASKGIVSALTAAKSLLDIADKRVENPNLGADQLIIPSGAQEDLEEILEKMSVVCSARFSDVEDPLSSIIVKTYLEAATDALRAADVGLDATRIAEMT
jgi:hypothetical protein